MRFAPNLRIPFQNKFSSVPIKVFGSHPNHPCLFVISADADDDYDGRGKPCVGLCYYKKLMSLENKYKDLDELENAANDDKNAVKVL